MNQSFKTYSETTGVLYVVTPTGDLRVFNMSKNPRFDLEKD